jgi:hypothetical protein
MNAATELDPALEPDRGPLQTLHSREAGWAGHGFTEPNRESQSAAAASREAALDQAAADAARAAEVHGAASPEHDAAMDAHAELEAG